jgi:hypothetical protein
MPFLPAMAAGFENGHALDPNFMQRCLHAFELGNLDNGFNFSHCDQCRAF